MDDEEQAAHDLVNIIGLTARAIPIEQAISILMTVVTQLIRASPHAESYWDQLAGGVEGFRREPTKTFVKGPDRVQ
jgi:hypothetical protein